MGGGGTNEQGGVWAVYTLDLIRTALISWISNGEGETRRKKETEEREGGSTAGTHIVCPSTWQMIYRGLPSLNSQTLKGSLPTLLCPWPRNYWSGDISCSIIIFSFCVPEDNLISCSSGWHWQLPAFHCMGETGQVTVLVITCHQYLSNFGC